MNFKTQAEGRAHIIKNDLGGMFVVEGKGQAGKPWAVIDSGLAEDLISDDIGRAAARALLHDADRKGNWTIYLIQYGI